MNTLYTTLQAIIKNTSSYCAVVDQNAQRKTTLKELLDLANILSSFLTTQNFARRALITLPRSMEYIATMIGLNKAGIAFAPLTDTEPKIRLDFIKEELNTDLIIDSAFLEKAKEYASKNPLKNPPENPRPENNYNNNRVNNILEKNDSNDDSFNNECFFVYTSGSTGKPKGILYDNQTILKCVHRNINILKLTGESIYTSNASFSFVAILFDIFTPLCAGSCLHITPDDARKDTMKLMHYINDNMCTHTFISPQMLSNMTDYSMPSLQKVVTGSERVSHIKPTTFEILNTYGMSESSVPVLSFRIDKSYENTPIGKPCDGMFVYLLDDDLKEVALGEEGEICIAGDISQGYFNLPDLHSQVFIKNPFATSEHDSILLRTGDIGKKLPDGNILYINRRDWMVKINGQRVELGEIEAVLKAMPEINKVVLKDFLSDNGQTYLCAYYTLKEGQSPPSEKRIRAHVSENLPPYMQPRFCIHLDALPINANGKLDRKALLAPNITHYQAEYEAPCGALEKALCEAFEHIFTLTCVGRNDNFFTLGGDSIQAVMLANKANELYEHTMSLYTTSATSSNISSHSSYDNIQVADIFTGKTPKGIAHEIQTKKIDIQKNSTTHSITYENIMDKENAPLTFAEKLIITEQMLDTDAITYNLNPVLHLHGCVNSDLLEKCLEILITRHTIFHASYVLENGQIVRKIDKSTPFYLEKVICPFNFSQDDQLNDQQHNWQHDWQNYWQDEITKRNVPYDISTGPLYRFTLFQISEQEHALLTSFHHTIFDATSHALFLEELTTLYTHNADHNALAPVKNDYFAFAYEQANNPKSFIEHNDFFINMFKDGIPQNSMPCHALRPNQIPFTEKYTYQTISSEGTEKLKKYARTEGVTVYTLLMAITALTISRYTSSEDIVLGTGMSGRDENASSIMGMFSKELPVRTKPCQSMLFKDYLADMNAVLDKVKKHQTCSLEAIISALQPERNPSRKLFYDVSVNYLHQPSIKNLGDVNMSLSTFVNQKMAIDLAFEIARCLDNSIQISLSYSPLLYEDKIVENILELFVTIVERITCGENGTLSELTRLPKSQEQELLTTFCGKECTKNSGQNVVTLFREQAKLHPHAIAVVSGETSLTYEELDTITDKLALYLIERGAKSGEVVGILVARNPFMVIGTLGVLKTGAAYLPLDPAYPPARLHFMLKDTGAFLTIVDENVAHLLENIDTINDHNSERKSVDKTVSSENFSSESFQGEILLTKTIKDLPTVPLLQEKQKSSNTYIQSPFPELKPHDPVVFLYTSGTTGIPKGVMWSHDGLTSFCTWYVDFFALTSQDKVTAYAGYSFDANAKETLPALTIGACVYILPEDMRLNLPVLQKYYNDNGITLSFMTTQVGRQFATLTGFTSLRALTMGGEGLVPFEPTGEINVYNLYGPTEGTCVVSGFHYDRYYDRPSVGKPTYNTDFYVLDDNQKLVPVGVEGELYIAGRQVALGYHNRPDVTKKAFLPNPYSKGKSYDRMYKTGDAVRFLSNGNLEVLGRRDSQVKIRGFRVELGEIENRIRKFESIANAVVIATNAPGGGKCAVAYVIAQDTTKNTNTSASNIPNQSTGNKIDIDALNAFIMEKLPEYMVPATIMQVDSIPLTPNGKVDTKKLPEPIFSEILDNNADGRNNASDTDSANKSDKSVRPLSRLQSECANIVESVLGHNTFSVSTNLLRAGLASLNAIMVMTKVSERFGISLSVNDFLASPTILHLEDLLINALLEKNAHALSENNTEESPLSQTQQLQEKKHMQQLSKSGQQIWPLSENQMGVYYECAKNPDSILYNIPLRIDLDIHQNEKGNTPDPVQLQKAVLAVIEAHPILRTRFIQENGILWQCQDYPSITINMLTCQNEDIESISQEFVRPFELLSAPLCRVSIMQSPSKISLLFDAHHCIFDGVSASIFLDKLRRAYDGETLQKERLSAVAMAQEEHTNTDFINEKEYIHDLLKNYQGVCELPADLHHDNKVGDLAEYSYPVDKNAVNTFCQKHGITPAALFLAASSYTLYRFLSLDTLYLTTISNGRSSTDLAQSIGMFVRTLPLAIEIETQETRENESTSRKKKTTSILEFIENTQKALRLSIAHEKYPFSRISQDYGFEPAIMYACELGIMPTQNIADQEIKLHSLAPNKPKFKLSIHVEERKLEERGAEEQGAEYVYALQYDNARYSHALIKRLTEYMAFALKSMIENPETNISQLSLANTEQIHTVQAFGQTPLEGEPETITTLFERIVHENQEKTALIACDQSLTFGELNALANRLAHSLLSRGMCIEDKIAFMLGRTSHVLIAMLGIMKAGCAFIPIDPTYPKDRVEHVLTDSNAPFLLLNTDNNRYINTQAQNNVISAEQAESPTEERIEWKNALEINMLIAEENNTENPVVNLSPDNLAYSIYTSGSTGKPKGVLLTHAGIANYVLPHPKNVQMFAIKKYVHTLLSITTVAFDMFLKEAFGALMNGVTLVFADEESTRDPLCLTALFEQTKPNAFSATPSRMSDFMENESLKKAILSCDMLMCGGEKYPASLLEYLKNSKAHVFNSYGPTEITVSSNAKELVNPQTQDGREENIKDNISHITTQNFSQNLSQSLPQITVGAPLYNTREYVVDKDNNLLPIGVTGELLVGGRGVARGYNNLEEETTKRFIQFNGERVYRTGDLAMWTPEGEILILGRNDGQIKLRGLRIELGEIEKALRALPEIKTCVVLVRTIDKTEHLCAYCVANTDTINNISNPTYKELDFSNIRTELAKSLTHYMVPTAYAQLESMPRTPNGKLDAKALPTPTIGQSGDYIAPTNELEASLCEVFREILQIERVGAEDNFFDNGGTSLGVTRLLGLAHKKGIRGDKGQGISYSNVFSCPTPRLLAQTLSTKPLPSQNADDKTQKTPTTKDAQYSQTSMSTDMCNTGARGSFIDGYDFSVINKALMNNNLDSMRASAPRPIGNALFTGASGFLGITLLYQFLKNEQGKAYCLLRKGKFSSVEKRLSNLLYFYFDESFAELMGSRIILIEGDVTENTWLENTHWLKEGETLDTVFNCAANVRHFAHDDSISRVNVGGTKHCIELCQKTKARLIHISTVSIGGFSIDGVPSASLKLKEQSLYFHQEMENQYVQSKFLAEYHVLSASLTEEEGGLPQNIDAKIMRVGNLMGHSSNGEFQINAKSNSFAGRLRALSLLGYAPYGMADQAVDLSPVDSVAQAILLLSQTASKCRVYHPVNNHSYLLGDLIDNMVKMGITLQWTEIEEFTKAFDIMREKMDSMEDMVSLIAYQGMTQGDTVLPIKADYHYTVQTLKRLQWQWPILGQEYQEKFLTYLQGLGYFDK